MIVFSHLAHQAGPQLPPSTGAHGSGTHGHRWPYKTSVEESLGICHEFFLDTAFVERLFKEIERLLDNLEHNWREVNAMELLLTLTLRAHALVQDAMQQAQIYSLLARARAIALTWMDALRDEVMNARDGDTSQRVSMYAFKAALLCRRTFVPLARSKNGSMTAEDLSSFVRAAICLQQNLTVDVNTMPAAEKWFLRRDAAMAHQLQKKIRSAIRGYPDSLNRAVCRGIGLAVTHMETRAGAHLWLDDPATNPQFDEWCFLADGSSSWVASVLHPSNSRPGIVSQHVSFHYTQGHILVDGETVGKLPDNIRDSKEVKELFGNKYLLAYPSAMLGMSHRLVPVFEDQTIHFGQHGGHVVIISESGADETYEYVPRQVFVDQMGIYDLPRGLVDDCCHWLGRVSGHLEIRRTGTKWLLQPSDWTLDVSSRQAQRRTDVLVDPFSSTVKLLSRIFHGFEDVQRLTVFQHFGAKETLSVELRHLEMSFFVNGSGRLESRELAAEVDPNQDAGTLYGYQSMIVLHEAGDACRRSIIAPLGELQWKRLGTHVSVLTKVDSAPLSTGRYGNRENNTGASSGRGYARFDIDSVLGHLTCPPEPRLLYTKAQLHAFTSLPCPDPLTGRTGEEEAFHTLMSGRCKRMLQDVTWDQHLPVGIQNDRYSRIVQSIVFKAHQLRRFQENAPQSESRELDQVYQDWANSETSVLATRGEVLRMRYECPRQDTEPTCLVKSHDLPYSPPGMVSNLTSNTETDPKCKASAVYQIVKMLRDRPQAIPMDRDISDTFNKWPLIGGFCGTLDVDRTPISTFLADGTIQEQWGRIAELCRRATDSDVPRVAFTLALLAFAPKSNMDAIRLLAAYSYLPPLRSPGPPAHTSYSGFVYNEALTVHKIARVVATEFVQYVPGDITATGWYAIQSFINTAKLEHLRSCEKDATQLAERLLPGWPQNSVPDAGGFTSKHIYVDAAVEKVATLWNCLRQNRDLSIYVTGLQNCLSTLRTCPRELDASSGLAAWPPTKATCLPRGHIIPSLTGDLVQRPLLSFQPMPVPSSFHPGHPRREPTAEYHPPREFAELRQIIVPFEQSTDTLRQNYGDELASSLVALETLAQTLHASSSQTAKARPSSETVSDCILTAEKCLKSVLGQIKMCFSADKRQTETNTSFGGGHNWLQRVGLWPRLTPVSILELLQSSTSLRYGDGMKQALLHYGELVASYQRLLRLRRALQRGDDRRIGEELANEGHTNWSPLDHPDWLLLEIDSNSLIREEQATVALAMIAPQSGSNSVFQLNMGKGKTSMILPMVLAELANGKQLARLIVPKALLLPTAQIMQLRLGGLIGREVRHVSFSRSLIAGDECEETVHIFEKHHSDLVLGRGILISTPEKILAFKLSGPQSLADGKDSVALKMIRFQERLEHSLCRDVLDESDFTLAVRTQLVYPSGDFIPVDGAPHRWELVQELLSLVEDNLHSLKQQYPRSITVVKRPDGGFPMIHILHSGVEDELCRRIVQNICNGRVALFRPAPGKSNMSGTQPDEAGASPAETRQLLKKALSSNANSGDIDRVTQLFRDTRAVESGLLLVQGLINHGVLLACIKKRWNVNYGLHPQRPPIAVPYEARGVPSERSEFGHPDVAIIFTCLAFYYAGVDESQFRESLSHILHHVDDPATEYDKWASGDGVVNLPEELQHWNAINVDDDGQVEKLWENLRFTRSAVNHFLNTFVFPVHSRQFSVKLQASAWDLALFTPTLASAESSTYLTGARTTGFSGTNDNKAMLPLTIKQQHLPGLQQTNAEVLAYLLQPRNRDYICTGGDGSRWSEETLLQKLEHNNIRVLIDAGAFILEKRNELLARNWLAVVTDEKIKAAVYFDEKDNRTWVVFRDASAAKAPLISTPFSDRLGECLVYFDEAHTRGVDLQLPSETRGALTLALGQTKDHTMQAAMRLRQLGSTQSVVFYAPPEVDQSIRDICGLGNSPTAAPIQSPQVISWLLEQTCRANEQLGSLYASHGVDYCRRTDASWKYTEKLDEKKSQKSFLQVLEQPERRTLKVMYGSAAVLHTTPNQNNVTLPQLQEFAAQLHEYQHKKTTSHHISSGTNAKGAFEEVEQEREVEAEVEQQRNTQPRTTYTALCFPGRVCKAIRTFVQTGILSGGQGYESSFAYMARTGIGRRHRIKEIETRLFLSEEFHRTIKVSGNHRHPHDDFLRPVEWLLWSPSTETGVVVIPEELELLIPELRKATHVHLVSYAAPVTRVMLDFSSIKYYSFPQLPADYTLPTWLPVELGIIAGRLYMHFGEVKHMAKYLGQSMEEEVDMKDEGTPDVVRFCSNSTNFLLEWLPLRRAAQNIMHTPVAYLCQGRTLRPDHAFFSQSKEQQGPVVEDVSDQKANGIKDTGSNADWSDLGRGGIKAEEDDQGRAS